MAINYTGVDLDRYNAGNKFYSQDRFLQGVGLDKPAITFNSSPNNSGIMGMYPRYPYPPIMSEDGGDGGGPIGPRGNLKFDYEFDALGGLYNKDNVPLTDEERDTLNAQKNKDRLAMAGKLGLFALNPMGYLMGKGITKAFGFVKDKFFGGDSDSGSGGGGKGKGPATDYYGPKGGYQGSDEQDRDNENTTASSGTVDTGNFEQDGTGRQGYKDGYSVQDDMTDYATNVGKEASPGGGFEDSGGDGNNSPPPFYSTNEPPSNLTFNLVEDIDPAFSYSNRFGTLGGILNTTRTIQEEEPIGSLGYYDPSGNFGIGFDTDKGMVGAANLGNLNLGYTGVGGPTLDYMGGFANDAGRFGVNYNRDTGLNLGVSYNKKFNSGGIVGLYR